MPRRHLLINVTDERFGQSDVEGMFGCHRSIAAQFRSGCHLLRCLRFPLGGKERNSREQVEYARASERSTNGVIGGSRMSAVLGRLLQSGRTAFVMSFGRRLAYESLRRTNPAGRCWVWGFRVWTTPERSCSGAGSCAQIERRRESDDAGHQGLGVSGVDGWRPAQPL
jgi:hypothetical protein